MTEVFIMDYTKHYGVLMEKAKQRTEVPGYSETHHIVPKCLGGTNDKENLVDLYPEEHYIAHLLLAKIYGGKLWFAANMMANRNNKQYGWIKRKFAEENSKAHRGMKHTDESRKKMSLARKGTTKPDSHKKAIGEAHKKVLEYNGKIYRGYVELEEKTGVTKHLYKKYYLNGIDPLEYKNNNTHGMIKRVRSNPPRASLGKKWYNNGKECKYFIPGSQPDGWELGRIK